MIQKIILSLTLIILATSFSKGQNSKGFYESVINNADFTKRAPIALPYVDPSDVLWAKTIWRELILREKMNLPLYYPTKPTDGRMSLVDVLLRGIERSYKTAYDDDELKTPITFDEIKERFDAVGDTITRLNNETGERESIIVSGEMNSDEVKRILIKELWYFNKKSSQLECRIIAICPVREFTKDDYDGIMRRRLFWVDYGEFRDLFTKQKAFNYENDGIQLTLDDLFLKRFFSSRIYQESNVYDNRSISSYAVGMDAVLESDRIKNEIFNLEQDLWEY
ncbi:gliding motility protein GldN [Porphyromonadaceae bacterium OttesenSCG-928-L07]|nr:gliding motility protein GldN [Porphyromonadaceae bacterium OttesenSCG-928-L07]MDL2251622.1 gliding motility protein GldN [Odoribacter sp. OttesenSCG-928-J03]